MKLDEIKTPVSALPGIGPASEKLFAKLNIFTVCDLLKFYPRAYEDRRQRVPIAHFESAKVHTVAQVSAHEFFGYGRMKTLKIIISDGTASASLIAFNRTFLQHSLPVGSIVVVTGNFSVKYGQIQSTDFDVTKLSDSGKIEDFENQPLPDSGILPVYPLTEGLTQKTVRKAVQAAIKQYDIGIDNNLPEKYIKKQNLLSKKEAIKFIHSSENPAEIQEARKTLIYEELFFFQKAIAERAFKHKGAVPSASLEEARKAGTEQWAQRGKELSEQEMDAFIKNLSPLQKELLNRLPFSLTPDQIFVIDQMNQDIDRGFRERAALLNGKTSPEKIPFTMQRLLQGDVGSGKTLVAFFACLRVISWKSQCALMAPTEILARQHADSAAKLLEPLGVNVAFLTGNVKNAGRAHLLSALKSGEINIVIGTHALFSRQVAYNDLQLAVIDEQHRFGVVQRQSILEKGRHTETTPPVTFEPHLLMMSATPIPQTLALTVFGDLDVSVIKTMPKGRQPIQTYLVKEGNERNAYEAVRNQLKNGRQAYFVYPAITSENENGEIQDIKSAEENFRNLSQNIYPEYKCALLHSKVSEEEQIQILKDFQSGKIQVLAATTVIEVGVDIPNATCIVIEQADRFGLAQLHQLRGRVGRGSEQSLCFLIYSKKITETGIERMKVLRQNTDGFIIASQDLKLRGPGEITGTAQAGNLSLGIADIIRDHDILVQARNDAFEYTKNMLS